MRLAAAEKLAAVGKLAATVAHEIRNPLTAIKMWLLLNPGENPGRRRFGSETRHYFRGNDPLGDIIRDFLEFSRPMELRCRPIEVNCVLQQTLDLFEQRLKDCKVRVANTASSGPPAVVADADKLKQVFINLMGNALDAMAPGAKSASTRPSSMTQPAAAWPSSAFTIPAAAYRRTFRPGSSTRSLRRKRMRRPRVVHRRANHGSPRRPAGPGIIL